MSETLHFAYEYIDRGWPVIPISGKKPAVPWRIYQSQRPPLDVVKRWFSPGRYNLAIVTGRISGLVVIDCDTCDDASWWKKTYPHTPLAVSTGGGGRHFYYRWPGNTGNKTHVLDRKIDVRGDGGIVLAPPSITKRAYQWDPWSHYSLDEIPVFDPAWLGPPATPRTSRTDHWPVHVRSSGIAAYIRCIEAVSGSGGHNQTWRVACKLRDSGLSSDEALGAIKLWNQTNAKPPWRENELAHKIRDAYK